MAITSLSDDEEQEAIQEEVAQPTLRRPADAGIMELFAGTGNLSNAFTELNVRAHPVDIRLDPANNMRHHSTVAQLQELLNGRGDWLDAQCEPV